jgi:hypothetical protein
MHVHGISPGQILSGLSMKGETLVPGVSIGAKQLWQSIPSGTTDLTELLWGWAWGCSPVLEQKCCHER